MDDDDRLNHCATDDDGIDHYAADDAEEVMGYQRLAWLATPAGVNGLWLLGLALLVNLLRRLGRQLIRLASRAKLV